MTRLCPGPAIRWIVPTLLLGLGACAEGNAQPQAQEIAPAPVAAAPIQPVAAPPVAAPATEVAANPAPDPDFRRWLETLKRDALKQGVSAAVFDQAFTGVAPLPRVIELDRKQPEGTLTFETYLRNLVSAQRVTNGKAKMAEHGPLLQAVSKRYGVPVPIIVALWGVESDYGRSMGNFPTIAALATLAHDTRRPKYFREELMAALKILQRGDTTPAQMKGSWAGALGQGQFMPTTFIAYGTDWDGDGRRDIWATPGDVFASIANYVATVGWNANQTWGQQVTLPAGFDESLVGLKAPRRSLGEWQRLGIAVDPAMGPADAPAWLVRPAGGPTVFLIGKNYRTLLDWNPSSLFASSVGILADRLARP